METQVWTLIAVVIGTLVGSAFYLGQRIDNLFDQGRELLSHIYELKIKVDRHDVRFDQIDARFVQVDTGFEQVDTRFERIDRRFDEVDSRLDGLETQGEALAQQIYGMATALNDHLRRHAG